MNYKEALALINAAPRFVQSAPGRFEAVNGAIMPGDLHALTLMRRLLAELGNPQNTLRLVHVAGTNGKGSTCAMLAAMLQALPPPTVHGSLSAAPSKIALFTSPYLQDFTERFQINGRQMPKRTLCCLLTRVLKAREALQIPVLQFHFYVALALLWFAEEAVDVAIIEAGVGGRYDATNVLHPALCVITPIALDHIELLGDTLAKIAWQKAGIIKTGVPAVIAPQKAEAMAVLRETALQVGAPLIAATEPADIQSDLSGTAFRLGGIWVKTPLLGQHQAENAAAAWCAAQALLAQQPQQQAAGALAQTPPRGSGLLSPEPTSLFAAPAACAHRLQTGLSGARWPGRLEKLSDTPLVLLDGAHNPHGAQALAAALPALLSPPCSPPPFPPPRNPGGVMPSTTARCPLSTGHYPKVLLICGILDKNAGGMVPHFAAFAHSVMCTAPADRRALPPEELAALFAGFLPRSRISLQKTPAGALREALRRCRADPKLAIVAAGSLYLVGTLRTAWLKGQSL